MTSKSKVLTARSGFLTETYRKSGAIGCLKKISAAIHMYLPVLALGRRTNKSVGAYFDLITDDARMFYGDSFHFGYFKSDSDTLDQALENHTDIVVDMAKISTDKHILDVGCGVCAPAVRTVKKHGCRMTCINISGEQVKQGRALVDKHNLNEKIDVRVGNALELDFDDESFDSALCLEVAGDICVTKKQKTKFASEIHRVLKRGGHVGFSDLVFTGAPTCKEERAMRAILYHEGRELITDWASIFSEQGFVIKQKTDIIDATMKTWDHSLSVYEKNAARVDRRYGKKIANQTREHLRIIPEILRKHGSFLVMSAQKPA